MCVQRSDGGVCRCPQVTPEVCTLPPGHCADWELALAAPQHDAERAPDVDLLLRLQPLQYAG